MIACQLLTHDGRHHRKQLSLAPGRVSERVGAYLKKFRQHVWELGGEEIEGLSLMNTKQVPPPDLEKDNLIQET